MQHGIMPVKRGARVGAPKPPGDPPILRSPRCTNAPVCLWPAPLDASLFRRWADGWGESGFYRIRGDCPYPGALGVYSDDFITVPIRS